MDRYNLYRGHNILYDKKIRLDFYLKMWYKSTTKMEDKCLIIT